MFSLVVPVTVVFVVTTVAMIALHTTITRAEGLQAATVDAFDFPAKSVTASDTIAASAPTAQTVMSPAQDWQSVTVQHLGDATDLLDYLENHGIQTKEMVALSNHRFVVRWK